MKHFNMEVGCGDTIYKAVSEALILANRKHCKVCFSFNGVFVEVKPQDLKEGILENFHNQL